MNARVGNRIIGDSHRVGTPRRDGIIKEVRGDNRAPPYVVQWNDRDGEHLFFPTSDAHIEPANPRRRSVLD